MDAAWKVPAIPSVTQNTLLSGMHHAGESQAFFGHIANIARSEQDDRILLELWLIGHHMVHWRL